MGGYPDLLVWLLDTGLGLESNRRAGRPGDVADCEVSPHSAAPSRDPEANMDSKGSVTVHAPSGRVRAKLGWLLGGLAIVAAASFGPPAIRPAWSQPSAKASSKTQGQGTKIVLKVDFIKKFKDRVSIVTDFRVDKVGPKHSAGNDGEVHIGGVAAEAALPTVAELTNPEPQDINTFLDLESGSGAAQRTVKLEGVWRIWTEHPGTGSQVQGAGLPPRFNTSNPAHVFEIHPISKVGDRSLLTTFRPIPGFTPKDPTIAIPFYENTRCRIRKDGDKVEITAKSVGFNFIDFVFEVGDEGQEAVDDGRFVLGQIRDADGELIARRRRLAFLKGTQPELKVRTMGGGERMHLLGMPRLNLELVRWRLEHATPDVNDPDNPLNWDLPYEIIAVGLVNEGED